MRLGSAALWRRRREAEDVEDGDADIEQESELPPESPSALQCSFCHKTFSASATLKLHEQYHTGNFTYFCDQCQKGFPRLGHYKEHMQRHEGGFPCDVCGRVFTADKTLKYHMSEHTGIFRFRCETCGEGFNILDAYRRHCSKHS